MPEVRIFLLTCRRPALLPRALASLRSQTFKDWICELHNDAPEDDYPRRLVAETADPRIVYHHHEKNWGAAVSFRHAFRGGPEPFLALLEDDNWWEPDFLLAALTALREEPRASVAWANMRIWRENADHTWADTGRTIWDFDHGDHRPRLFHWPQPLQIFDALHSNGAMLCRSSVSCSALPPPDCPFDLVESIRERLVPGGWLLLPRPLAHFALTLQTSRSINRARWMQVQLLIAVSHLLVARPSRSQISRLWDTLRKQQPPATNVLFLAALSDFALLRVLRHARAKDWCRFLCAALRRPLLHLRAMRFRSDYPASWRALLDGACSRLAENPAPSEDIWRKQLKPCNDERLPEPKC
jgi:hypothetical protein